MGDTVYECWNCSWHFTGDFCPNPECAETDGLTGKERAAVVEVMTLVSPQIRADALGGDDG